MRFNNKPRPDDAPAFLRRVCAVQAVLEFDLGDGEEEFDEGFGELVGDMHEALAAIYRARREVWVFNHQENTSTRQAATRLVRIAAAIDRVIHRGRELTGD